MLLRMLNWLGIKADESLWDFDDVLAGLTEDDLDGLDYLLDCE